jgi:hypothetical protein
MFAVAFELFVDRTRRNAKGCGNVARTLSGLMARYNLLSTVDTSAGIVMRVVHSRAPETD